MWPLSQFEIYHLYFSNIVIYNYLQKFQDRLGVTEIQQVFYGKFVKPGSKNIQQFSLKFSKQSHMKLKESFWTRFLVLYLRCIMQRSSFEPWYYCNYVRHTSIRTLCPSTYLQSFLRTCFLFFYISSNEDGSSRKKI